MRASNPTESWTSARRAECSTRTKSSACAPSKSTRKLNVVRRTLRSCGVRTTTCVVRCGHCETNTSDSRSSSSTWTWPVPVQSDSSSEEGGIRKEATRLVTVAPVPASMDEQPIPNAATTKTVMTAALAQVEVVAEVEAEGLSLVMVHPAQLSRITRPISISRLVLFLRPRPRPRHL